MLLEQEHLADARNLIQTIPLGEIAITDFAVHSIGIIMSNERKEAEFRRFVSDVLLDTPIVVLHLSSGELGPVLDARELFNLDFDDAYMYVAAEKYNLTLVSFDADFDRTERGRKTPADVLKQEPERQ
jgi:predicted nucleic acid-binding protein